LGATEGTDRRGRVLRILTDLPLSPRALGHNAVKLRGLRKAIERIKATEPYLKFDHFELTNEGLRQALHARDTTRSPDGRPLVPIGASRADKRGPVKDE
jgi:hypothetical protein